LTIGIIIIVYILLSVIEAVGYNGVDLLNLISMGGGDGLGQLRAGKLRRYSYIQVTAGLYKKGGDLDNGMSAIIINGFNNINLVILVVLSVININL
jgi:hypothetical protein